MVTSTCSGLLIDEQRTLLNSNECWQVVKGLIEAAHDQPFYVLLTDLSEKQEFLPKHMTIAQSLETPRLLTPAKTNLLDSEPNTVAAVHYKLPADKGTQIWRHETRDQLDDKKFKHNLEEKSNCLETMLITANNFSDILTKFQSMWDVDLEQVNIPKHRIQLTTGNIEMIHFAFYRTTPKVREFEKAEINKMLLRKSRSTSSDWMDRIDSTYPEKGRIPTFLRAVQKVKGRYQTCLIINTWSE